MTDVLDPKNAEKFYCGKCDFICCKKSNYVNHLRTLKHKNTDKILTNTDAENAENASVSNNFVCECGKEYKHRQSLFNHKKLCVIENNSENKDKFIDTIDKDDLILMLIKQNAELIKEQGNIRQIIMEQQNIVLEIAKNGTHNTTNSHNKSFNLQFFLNETCKDAMNIMDFVDSIKLQLSDLEKVGEIGYVNGISNIIVKNLNELDVTKRPIHCADKKREILYVKDENKWEKEADEKNKIRKAIKMVANKNIKVLPKFKEVHPDCLKSESKYSDQYNKIVVESFGGSGNNDIEKEDKIIKNIAKGVGIEK
jgi:hypothetical protein